MGCSQSGSQAAADVGAPRLRPEPANEKEKTDRESRRDVAEKNLLVRSTKSQLIEQWDGTSMRPSASQGTVATGSDRVVHGMTSQAFFSRADQTIIIFDWDDTLCPSTAIRRYARFNKQGKPLTPIDQATQMHLHQVQEQVIPLLQLAKQLGKVVLVTNAKRPWVDISCRAFLPNLRDLMKSIPTIYAVELVQQEQGASMSADMLLTETKARAMKASIQDFYSRYPGQSWKNIVSIGDAFFEHNAVRQVVEQHGQSADKRCRCKTIKLLDGPTASGLVIQLSIVGNWIRKIVEADDDVAVDFSADEEQINRWVAEFAETEGVEE